MSRESRASNATREPAGAGGSAFAAGRHRDLCSTCNHAKTCGGRSTPERPIFFCEQFDASARVPAPKSARAASSSKRDKRTARRYKGLCMNCDNRKGCNIPKAEGGIWHCQEYV